MTKHNHRTFRTVFANGSVDWCRKCGAVKTNWSDKWTKPFGDGVDPAIKALAKLQDRKVKVWP